MSIFWCEKSYGMLGFFVGRVNFFLCCRVLKPILCYIMLCTRKADYVRSSDVLFTRELLHPGEWMKYFMFWKWSTSLRNYSGFLLYLVHLHFVHYLNTSFLCYLQLLTLRLISFTSVELIITNVNGPYFWYVMCWWNKTFAH